MKERQRREKVRNNNREAKKTERGRIPRKMQRQVEAEKEKRK